jgi:hypothetical protein
MGCIPQYTGLVSGTIEPPPIFHGKIHGVDLPEKKTNPLSVQTMDLPIKLG